LLTDLGRIRNKHVRTMMFRKMKNVKATTKAQARRKRQQERETLGEDAPPIKPQQTIETKYPPKERDNDLESIEEELIEEQAFDEFSSHFDKSQPTKILITTSINIRRHTRVSKDFMADLVSLIPNAQYFPRKKFGLQSIQKAAIEHDFTGIVVVAEEHKNIHSLYHICLPEGPTAHYRVSNIRLHAQIRKPDNPTRKYPELITKNFTTRLGKRVVRMLQTIFPSVPNLQSRQAVTFHNQRDFIFIRRHRYQFQNEGKDVAIREVGPGFTLRLRSLQLGLFDSIAGEYEFKYNKAFDERRKRFFL